MPTARPMLEADIPAVHDLMGAAFGDLDRRLGAKYAGPHPQLAQTRLRFGRVLATDPDGSFVAERDGRVAGCASAIVREGLWGLSMFIVDPAAQGTGVGRELLAAAVAYGNGCRGRVILASRDPRAIAMYARLGLDMEPSVSAQGVPRNVEARDVRPGGAQDLPLTEAIDRAVRGAAHGHDLLAMIAGGQELLIAPDRGYAVRLGGTVRLLAAFDERGAADVLRGALARMEAEAETANVEWITARQRWAVPVCLDAGLHFSTNAGPVFTGGDVGPFHPYLPSGSYL
jgi:ribosomal protein S18 acetylase RimI-like enzyme